MVSTRDSGPAASGLLAALARGNVAHGCFFTNDGVELLRDADFSAGLASAERAYACEHSWAVSGGGDCPVALGSQTDNSAMIGETRRIVSL